MARSPDTLARALKTFTLGEVVHYDFWIGLLGGAGGAATGWLAPEVITRVSVPAAGVIGIVIAAALAGAAILAGFMDQALLRKLRTIGKEPVRYIAPFLFTCVLGVLAVMALLVRLVLPEQLGQPWDLIASGGLGFITFWALASVLPDLSMLVQFLVLQADASQIPDDLPRIGSQGEESQRRVE